MGECIEITDTVDWLDVMPGPPPCEGTRGCDRSPFWYARHNCCFKVYPCCPVCRTRLLGILDRYPHAPCGWCNSSAPQPNPMSFIPFDEGGPR